MKLQILLACLAFGWLAAEELPPEEVAKGLEEKVGQQFTFTDEILHKTKKQEIAGFVKFETVHVRCILSQESAENLQLLNAILKERTPRRATITGTVTLQKDLQVFLEVTSIERPRYKKRSAE